MPTTLVVRSLYHGTFKEPGKSHSFGGGIHLGTKKAAFDRLDQTRGSQRQGRPGGEHLFVGDLTLKKPYGTPDHPISEHELFLIANLPSEKKRLLDAGYDGVVYSNIVEDPGSVSYWAFDASSVTNLHEVPLEEAAVSETVQSPEDTNWEENGTDEYGNTLYRRRMKQQPKMIGPKPLVPQIRSLETSELQSVFAKSLTEQSEYGAHLGLVGGTLATGPWKSGGRTSVTLPPSEFGNYTLGTYHTHPNQDKPNWSVYGTPSTQDLWTAIRSQYPVNCIHAVDDTGLKRMTCYAAPPNGPVTFNAMNEVEKMQDAFDRAKAVYDTKLAEVRKREAQIDSTYNGAPPEDVVAEFRKQWDDGYAHELEAVIAWDKFTKARKDLVAAHVFYDTRAESGSARLGVLVFGGLVGLLGLAAYTAARKGKQSG